MKQLRPYTVYLIYSGMMAFVRYLHFIAAAVYYVRVVGLNPFQLVLVGTTLMVVIMVSETPTGVIADTYSRRLSVIIGVALTGVGFILEGAVAHFTAILVAQLIWGVGGRLRSSACWPWRCCSRCCVASGSGWRQAGSSVGTVGVSRCAARAGRGAPNAITMPRVRF